ncbi:MAG: Crp/Fnr family transcriptional regulator [Actinomycetota bacterium]
MDVRHTGNLLLDAIPIDDREAVLIDVVERPIDVGGTWLAAGDQIETVLFPTSGTMSLIAETGDASVEAATVGREGVVDVFAALASRIAPQRVIGQVPGSFLAIPVDQFQKIYDHAPVVRRLIQGYIEALFVQISVNAACLAVHHLNERCARWLLQTHDRVDSDTFELKQEFLAMMLGVHRPSVSIAAKTLQASGLVTYKRGKITVLDREALEDAACPCYETIRSAYSRLVPLR